MPSRPGRNNLHLVSENPRRSELGHAVRSLALSSTDAEQPAKHQVDLRRDWRGLIVKGDETPAAWHHVEVRALPWEHALWLTEGRSGCGRDGHAGVGLEEQLAAVFGPGGPASAAS